KPYITRTSVGEAPVGPGGKVYGGTGYAPCPDPARGLDADAKATMEKYLVKLAEAKAARARGMGRGAAPAPNTRGARRQQPGRRPTGAGRSARPLVVCFAPVASGPRPGYAEALTFGEGRAVDPRQLDERLSHIATQWTVLYQAHAGAPEEAAAARQLLMQRYCGAVYRY